MIDPAFPALSKALSGSLLWRAGITVAGVLATAWPSSFAAGIVTPIRTTWDRPLVASIAVVGGTLCLLLQPAIPEYVRPGLPWMWPVAAIAITAVVAVNRRAVEEAWPHSTLARLFAQRRRRR